jgi:hypothetical protein
MALPASSRDLDAVREDVIQALGVHFANDAISIEELDQRLTIAIRATTRAELTDVIADLPIVPDYARGPAAVSRTEVATSRDVPPRGFIGAFMGGSSRKGSWHVPQHLKCVAIMGGVELDLSAACFAPGVTEIEVYALMGGVEVIVPHGVRVEALGFAFMGGFETTAGDVRIPDPFQPVIRLTGFVGMGGVEARHKKPSKRKLKKFEKRLNELQARLRGEG